MIVGGLGVLLVVVLACIWYLRRPAQDEWSKYTIQFRDYVEQKRKIMCQGGLHCDLSIRSLSCAFIAEGRGSPFAGDTTRKLMRNFMRENGLSEYS